jgi:hypothetical protein
LISPEVNYFLEAFGVGMLGALATLAGFAFTAYGQPAQQKKYRLPL